MQRIGTICLAAALGTAALLPGAPAAAQTLRERIDLVKQEREKRAERSRTARKVEFLQALYYRSLTVTFSETPAREAFEYIRTALGIPLVVRYADDATGSGIDPELPITMDAREMQALELLDLVLEQCSISEPCTWQLRQSFVEVGTKERLSVEAAQEVRTYPIDDLIYEPPHFTDAPSLRLDTAIGAYGGYYSPFFSGGTGYYPGSGGYGGSFSPSPAGAGASGGSGGDPRRQGAQELMDLITQSIEPEAWTVNGGSAATISYSAGSLVVRAPDFVQRQIGGYPRVPAP